MAHTKMRIQDGDIRWVRACLYESIERRIDRLEEGVTPEMASKILQELARIEVVYMRCARALRIVEQDDKRVAEWTTNAMQLAERSARGTM